MLPSNFVVPVTALFLFSPAFQEYSCKGFNKIIRKFFNLLEGFMDRYSFISNRIYNCDETRINTVQSRPPKVMAGWVSHLSKVKVTYSSRGFNTFSNRPSQQLRRQCYLFLMGIVRTPRILSSLTRHGKSRSDVVPSATLYSPNAASRRHLHQAPFNLLR